MDVPRKSTRKRRRWIFGGVGLAALVLVTLALSNLKPAAPSVEGGTLWTDTVRKGDMLRQVRGPGTLAAEEVRWVSAVTQGRVERKLIQPGTAVTAFTYSGELGTDLWTLGAWWAERVGPSWERTVATSLEGVRAEAERRARRQRRQADG